MFARAMTREAARSREVVPESTITRRILGMRVDATTYDRATERVLRWAEEGSSRYVCIANVHMVMEAYDDDDLQQLVNRADLVTSDGMPLVWGLKAMGVPEAERVCGPLLTPAVMERAARDGVPIGLYGGANERALRRLIDALYARFPTLKIAFAAVPPYRPLTPEEDEALIGKIVESGARI
ncbi:MAG: WecB/TagA/CpsF family glycosyltransferase, partial [Fimbriimonadales bacterium]